MTLEEALSVWLKVTFVSDSVELNEEVVTAAVTLEDSVVVAVMASVTGREAHFARRGTARRTGLPWF